MEPSKGSGVTNAEVLKGAVVLICAQLAAASTASCVKALPVETPSVLRGLWRQTLSSFIFSLFAVIMWLHSRYYTKEESAGNTVDVEPEPDEKTSLLPKISNVESEKTSTSFSAAKMTLIALTVIGATLLNDTIVIALRYTSSAAVMCLCNTTPIWLIMYAIIDCRAETPGVMTLLGASLSLFGTIVCSTGEGDEGTEHENERLGAIIATVGAIGGAIYMTACRKLAPCGLHPVHLSVIINIGMMTTTCILCLATLPDGIVFFSRDVSQGFFGFLNPRANPAALLHSIFPDLGGNFGVMLALRYFEPLVVSMVMLTEPLNASCAIVLLESNKDAKNGLRLRERSDTTDTLDTIEREEGYDTADDDVVAEHIEQSFCSARDQAEYSILNLENLHQRWQQRPAESTLHTPKQVSLGLEQSKHHIRRVSMPDEILGDDEETQRTIEKRALLRYYDTFHSFAREQQASEDIGHQSA